MIATFHLIVYQIPGLKFWHCRLDRYWLQSGLARELGYEMPGILHSDNLGLNVAHPQTERQVFNPLLSGALSRHCRSVTFLTAFKCFINVLYWILMWVKFRFFSGTRASFRIFKLNLWYQEAEQLSQIMITLNYLIITRIPPSTVRRHGRMETVASSSILSWSELAPLISFRYSSR